MSRRKIDIDELKRLADAVEAAAQQAVAEALAMHKRLGNPIAVWENGAVRWIPPDEIDVPETSKDNRQADGTSPLKSGPLPRGEKGN